MTIVTMENQYTFSKNLAKAALTSFAFLLAPILTLVNKNFQCCLNFIWLNLD